MTTVKKSRFHCDECDKVLMATPSGAVCPDGHGRLRTGITNGQLKRYEKRLREWDWYQKLPTIKPRNPLAKNPTVFIHDGTFVVRCRVEVDGVKRIKPRPKYGVIEGVTAVLLGDRPVYVKPRPSKVMTAGEPCLK